MELPMTANSEKVKELKEALKNWANVEDTEINRNNLTTIINNIYKLYKTSIYYIYHSTCDKLTDCVRNMDIPTVDVDQYELDVVMSLSAISLSLKRLPISHLLQDVLDDKYNLFILGLSSMIQQTCKITCEEVCRNNTLPDMCDYILLTHRGDPTNELLIARKLVIDSMTGVSLNKGNELARLINSIMFLGVNMGNMLIINSLVKE